MEGARKAVRWATPVLLTKRAAIGYSFGSTIDCCFWYFPFLSA
jgi:hypothetical protein